LRVFCTLLILPRISFIPAIAYSMIEVARDASSAAGSGPRRFKVRPIRDQ
jgi:hypothetical protein